MVRLADLQESDQDNMLKKIPLLPRFAEHHWVRGPKLAARRVAIVSTAGLYSGPQIQDSSLSYTPSWEN